MADADLTVAILREIRDEIRTTRGDLGERLDAVRVELKAEIGETNARLTTVEETLKELAAQLLTLTRYVKNVVNPEAGLPRQRSHA